MVQLLMVADVQGLDRHRRHERTTYRNDYHDRMRETHRDTLHLWIPKLRQGGYFPPFLELCTTSKKAPGTVIQGAWMGGDSTRRVDDLVLAMGVAGISKNTTAKLRRSTSGSMISAALPSSASGPIPTSWIRSRKVRVCSGPGP